MILEESISVKKVWRILSQITDPEIPVISIVDLGIVKDVLINSAAKKNSLSPLLNNGQQIEIIITPTYSGCPAMNTIAINIRMALLENGIKNIKITEQLSPAWTTDWITKKGKDKLRDYGIAPPQTRSHEGMNKTLFSGELNIECPQCRSKNTTLLSQFGSTACKALYQCADCKEPFDYFKCH